MKKALTAGGLILIFGALFAVWFQKGETPPSSPSSSATVPPGATAPQAPRPSPQPAAPAGPLGAGGGVNVPRIPPRPQERAALEPPEQRIAPEPPRDSETQPATNRPVLEEPAPPAIATPLPPANPPPIPETPAAPSVTPPTVTPIPALPPGSQQELSSVQEVIGRYQQMYNQLDAAAVASIWPRVDSRELARIFARLQSQELSFASCVFAVADGKATAQCEGLLRYVPRVGNQTPRSERHLWTIQLERAGEIWSIVQVTAR